MLSGLRAPFEVRNLELLDQGRMFVLQRQQRGALLGILELTLGRCPSRC